MCAVDAFYYSLMYLPKLANTEATSSSHPVVSSVIRLLGDLPRVCPGESCPTASITECCMVGRAVGVPVPSRVRLSRCSKCPSPPCPCRVLARDSVRPPTQRTRVIRAAREKRAETDPLDTGGTPGGVNHTWARHLDIKVPRRVPLSTSSCLWFVLTRHSPPAKLGAILVPLALEECMSVTPKPI